MSSTFASEARPADRHDECRIRIAAAGDIHYGERSDDRERARAAFAGLDGRADVVLLAGDLSTHGEPEQAAIVADAVRDLEVPVLEAYVAAEFARYAWETVLDAVRRTGGGPVGWRALRAEGWS